MYNFKNKSEQTLTLSNFIDEMLKQSYEMAKKDPGSYIMESGALDEVHDLAQIKEYASAEVSKLLKDALKSLSETEVLDIVKSSLDYE